MENTYKDLSLLGLASPISKHYRRHTDRVRTREQVEGRGGAKLYNGKKAWSSLNHSILSASWHRVVAIRLCVPTTVRGVLLCTTVCFITLDYLVTSSLSLFRKARTTASWKVRGKRVRTHIQHSKAQLQILYKKPLSGTLCVRGCEGKHEGTME